MPATNAADTLICVAGMPCSGKSTFMRRLRDDAAAREAFADTLGLARGAPWHFIAESRIATFDRLPSGVVVMHCDLMGLRERETTTFGEHQVVAHLNRAQRRIVITLWAPPIVLRRRLERRYFRKMPRKLLSGRLRSWIGRQSGYRAFYRDPAGVNALYQRWFEFLAQRPAESHWIVDAESAALTLHPPAQWRALARERSLPV